MTLMEHFLEEQRGLKGEVYELFRQHPELLPPYEEGMTKGGWAGGRRAAVTAGGRGRGGSSKRCGASRP